MGKENYQIILPGGDLESTVLSSLEESGLRYEQLEGFRFRVDGLPLDLITDRPGSVPDRVIDPDAEKVIAGITGSDILWQNDLRGEGLVLPIDSGSRMYIGATPQLVDESAQDGGREPRVSDLRRTRVDTKFPKIAADVLEEKGVTDVDIRYSPGKVEAQYLMYPRSRGIVEVWSSGRSAIENNISVVEFIQELSPVTVNLFEGSTLSADKRRVISQFGAALLHGANNMRTRQNQRVPVNV